MREKTRKLILSIFLAACIVALMAASLSYTLTNGRYTGGKLSEDSPYDDIIDFVGATKYTVSTPEELVNAIENGYSYIEIDKNAPDPFVINNNIADVATNLVLNVNGHSLVRNSRNPLINVQKNVSVVLVYDSESIDESTPEEDMGGFYNPVGSALQTSGGTLTVGQGKYESGPRSSVGSSFNLFTPNYLFTRTSRTADSYAKNTDTSVQVPNITNKQDIYIQPDTTETNNYINDYIKGDTYLIYTEEKNAYIPTEGENAGKLIVNAEEVTGEEGTTTTVSGDEFFVPCNVASCDFYYYYPVADTESTVGSGDQAQTVQTYAVIYGYNEVKSLAQTENETLTDANGREADNVLVWPYAAIRSEAGSAYARGGEFYTYFGTVNTYGIYSSGGIMTVGGEASADPEFSARGQGTCIYMAADESGDETDNILTIDSGTFSSEIGDTIKMFGGKMNVKAGTFTKSGDSTDNSTKTAIIHMTGGALTAAGSADANGKKSIQMTCAASTGTLSNVFGVYSEGGTVSLQNAQINVNGTYSAGVLAVTDGQAMSADEYAVTVADSAIEVNFNESALSSSGISTEGGNIQLEGSVSVFSQGLGITARKGSINIASGTAAVTTQRGTGVYVNNGTLTVNEKATLSVKPTMSENSWVNPPGVSGDVVTHYDGVVVQGGSLVSNGTLNVTFTGLSNDAFESGDTYLTQQIKSYAVRVEAASGSDTKVTIALGRITNSVGGGVYVGGGTVTLGTEDAGNSNLSVYTQGSSADNGSHYVSGGDWQYDWTITGGHAVEVQGGSLTVNSGTYTAKMGNGILVRNLEGSDQSYTVTVNNGIFAGYNGSGRRVGPGAFYALKVMGGPLTLNVNGGTFGKDNTDNSGTNGSAFVMGDPVNKKRATVNVTGGNYYSYQSDCFSIFRYVDIAFETENITMNAARKNNSDVFAAVAVQDDLVYNGNEHEARGSTIEIAGGKYTGVGYGLWYGASVDAVAVSGGTFTGTNEAGLYFGVAPNGDNVQLSGGTFYGPKNDVRLSHSWSGIPQPSNNANYNAIDGQDIDYSRILLEGYSANGDTQYDGSVNNGAETAEGTYTTTKILTRLKERGEVRVEEYGIWYTTHLVFSKITVQ